MLRPMETETQFIERRRTARAAGTVDLDNDPLVIAVRQQWRDAEEVSRRFRERRQAETQETRGNADTSRDCVL